MRNMVNNVNGVTAQTYLANMSNMNSNPQALLAAYNAANAGGMASPGMGLSMPNMGAGSPRPQPINAQQTQIQLRELENKYRAQFPNHTQDAIRTMAMEHLSRLIVQRQQHMTMNQNISQSAMNAAAGSIAQQVINNGMTPTTSPHQYAQLLRAQQQAQAQVVAQQQGQQGQQGQQAQQAQQTQQSQHQRQTSASQLSQRQSSGSATPGPGHVNTGNTPAPNPGNKQT
jgi:chromatin modification-related protein VID21